MNVFCSNIDIVMYLIDSKCYKHDSFSYILINPAFDEKLQAGDIVYVLYFDVF